MPEQKPLSFQDKINIINNFDEEMNQLKNTDYRKLQLQCSQRTRSWSKMLISSNIINTQLKWLKVATNENIPLFLNGTRRWRQQMCLINGPLLCAQAQTFTVTLRDKIFKSSDGWLMCFLNCHRRYVCRTIFTFSILIAGFFFFFLNEEVFNFKNQFWKWKCFH